MLMVREFGVSDGTPAQDVGNFFAWVVGVPLVYWWVTRDKPRRRRPLSGYGRRRRR